MIVLFEICDPDHPLGRVLCADEEDATRHREAVIAQYGHAPNIQRHRFKSEEALIAFLDEDLRDWQPYSVTPAENSASEVPEPRESDVADAPEKTDSHEKRKSQRRLRTKRIDP